MTAEMADWIDANSQAISEHLGTNVSRGDIIRECVARIAWDYFDTDIE